jgi:hypothetical protein
MNSVIKGGDESPHSKERYRVRKSKILFHSSCFPWDGITPQADDIQSYFRIS